jgi:hypothetical protein
LNAGAGFGDDKGGTIAFHPIGAVRAGVKGAVGTVGRRRRRRRRRRLVHQQGQKEKALSTIKSMVIGRTVIKMNGRREKEQKGRTRLKKKIEEQD